MKPTPLLACLLLAALPAGLSAQSISVNFRNLGGSDQNSVDVDESGTQFATVGGQFWNNITVRANPGGAGSVNVAFDNTTLIDSDGNNAAVLNTTVGVGAGYSNFGDTSSPSQALTAEAGMMQSFLNFGASAPSETITINGLGPEFTTGGYAVYLYFDLDQTRTYGLSVDDGTTSATFWTADTATDADSNDDGIIEWVQATGTNSGTATPNASYAVYENLTGSSFTISGLSTGGRATLNGFQIIADTPTNPNPATGKTISLNLYNRAGDADANQVDAGETAGYFPVAGEHWNNVGFNNGNQSGAASMTTRSLTDENGDNAATFQSTLGSAYIGYSGASGGSEGNRNLMSSYLAYATGTDTGHLRISGLPDSITTNGYRVLVYFDTDNANRSHTVTLTPDGAAARNLFGDDSGTFTGEFVPASGAGTYANMAVFENITAAAFTLNMDSDIGRAAVNGIQIISNDLPFPPGIDTLTSSDYYVTPGTSVTLSWETSGADTLTLDPGNIDLLPLSTDGNGSTSVTVNATTTYTVTASNPAGNTTETIRVGAGPPRPNILFFLVDDMGWQDTSVPFHHDAAGNPVVSALNNRYRTPAMETLAANGMKFTNAYACSVCTPTRVSIMTGMNSARHHVTTWTYPSVPQDTGSNQVAHLRSPADWRMEGMTPDAIALPALLQQAGYRTIHAGKAHFGPNSTFGGDPTNIGFDVNIAGHGAGGPGSYWGTANFGTGIWHIPGLEDYHGQDIFLTEVLTLEMNKAIEQSVNDGVPFFAYMAHYAVHAPFTEDPRFAANYPSLSGNAKAFATMIEGMDKSLGDIMTRIDQLGVAEDTLVIFLSDNGGDMTNTPLRAKKGHRYEGGMRVPMIVGWAKLDGSNSFQSTLPIPAASREDDIVACYDMFPTVAGIGGAGFAHAIDGHDLRPYFTATPGTHRPQEFLMHFPNPHNSDFFTTLRQGDWKLIHNYANGSNELYNLADDLAETTNLAATQPERTMTMARAMARQLDAMGAQYPRNINTGSDAPPVMPLSPGLDLDADGLDDNAEDPNRNGLKDPGETDPDNANTDGDNVDDGSEALLGLNPLDPNSYFYLTGNPQPDDSLVLTWPSLPGTTFEIRSSPDLSDWSRLVAPSVPADPGTSTSHTVTPSGAAREFYRVGLNL